jgi:hypothetical protein
VGSFGGARGGGLVDQDWQECTSHAPFWLAQAGTGLSRPHLKWVELKLPRIPSLISESDLGVGSLDLGLRFATLIFDLGFGLGIVIMDLGL